MSIFEILKIFNSKKEDKEQEEILQRHTYLVNVKLKIILT